MGVAGRVILWLNSFAVPSAVSIYMLGCVGAFASAVFLINTLWFDFKVRPRVEAVFKKVEKLLNALP